MGIVYLYDTNLWVGLEDKDDLQAATQQVQEDMNMWGGLLQEAGGTIQPPKCTWIIHDMVQDKKGEWVYRDAERKKRKGKRERRSRRG